MAIPHAQPGQVFDVHASTETLVLSKTTTLIKTPHIELIRMVLPAGKVLSEHKAPGELIFHCLQGQLTVRTMGQAKELQSGRILFLSAKEPHSVVAIEHSWFLLTLVLPRATE